MPRTTIVCWVAALIWASVGIGCGSGTGNAGGMDLNASDADVNVDGDAAGPDGDARADAGVDGGEDTTTDDAEPAAECSSGDDCRSGVCREGFCAPPSCEDGVRNGVETDVDCGGPDCGPCPKGERCLADGDCETGVCGGPDSQTCAECEDGRERTGPDSCGFEDRGTVEETCGEGEWKRTGCTGAWYENCQEIAADLSDPDSDVYAIDPDGEGGLRAFDVYCDMETDGGPWIRLTPRDSNGDAIFAGFNDHSDRGKCGSSPVEKFDDRTASQFKGADFVYGGPGASTENNPLVYENPATGNRYSPGQMSLLRDKVADMSAESRQVAFVCDDDGLDPAHEVYLYDRQGIQRSVTPGTTENDEAHYYLFHTTPAETLAEGPDATPPPLETNQILPSAIQYGHFGTQEAAGGVVWGYERGYALIQLAD